MHLGQLSLASLKSVVEKHTRLPGAGASILRLKTQTVLCISLVSVIGKECACLSNGFIKHRHFQLYFSFMSSSQGVGGAVEQLTTCLSFLDSTPGGGEIFRTRLDWHWCPASSYSMVSGCTPGVKVAGVQLLTADTPTTSEIE